MTRRTGKIDALFLRRQGSMGNGPDGATVRQRERETRVPYSGSAIAGDP